MRSDLMQKITDAYADRLNASERTWIIQGLLFAAEQAPKEARDKLRYIGTGPKTLAMLEAAETYTGVEYVDEGLDGYWYWEEPLYRYLAYRLSFL